MRRNTKQKFQNLIVSQISSGLKRRSVTQCSQWAEAYRIMGKPFPGQWTFKYHPWLREMHDCDAELIVGQKAAQMGYTEVALNKVFKAIDIDGISVLYILPASQPDASDFSSARFDPALELSPHLSNLFTDVRNIGHKRAGNANLYIRGSKSRSQLKSVPVGLLVLDELDEMNQENIALAAERMSGQLEKQELDISTPTIDRHGINARYINSTMEHFFFACPHCKKLTELIFPDCVIITANDINDSSIENTHLICKECKHPLDHQTKFEWLKFGKWVKSYTDRAVRGFHINQLYSSTVRPAELARAYFRSKIDPNDEQEFYNSKLGVTHIVEGARITTTDIEKCTRQFQKVARTRTDRLVTMGVDVGKFLHYEIDEWMFDSVANPIDINLSAVCRVLMENKVVNFEELDALMQQYNIRMCVIDANPERRKAIEFVQRFYGRAKICFYGNNLANSKQVIIHDQPEQPVTVDRTSWLDVSLARFRTNRIFLPVDLSKEYIQHVTSIVRIYEKDKNGNPVGRYISEANREDHFAHARTYSEIAFKVGHNVSISKDMRSPV